MVNYLKKLRNEQHRAVAPIIATLIMVAIAVVGGVMVYVFTQGFFTSTSTTGPTSEILTLTGYDSREVADPTDHLGAVAATGDASGGTAGFLDVGNELVLHVKNIGTGSVSVSTVKVNGTVITPSNAAPPSGTNGKFGLIDNGGTASSTNGIADDAAASIVVTLSERLQTGRSVAVVIATDKGSEFTYNIDVGSRE